jgi:hypothetical protein
VTLKPYLVCTKHRGVFAGLVDSDTITQRTLALIDARMALYWSAETRGVNGLASAGPAEGSKISAPADIPALHDVTAVMAITEVAWARWTAA